MESSEKIRTGEKELSPYRTGRFYAVANEWYFSVRETSDQGPYASKAVAEEKLKNYISDQEHFSDNKNVSLKLL